MDRHPEMLFRDVCDAIIAEKDQSQQLTAFGILGFVNAVE